MMPDVEDEEALEVPDVFDLRPLSTQRITLRVREIHPAPFYYVPDEDDFDKLTKESKGESCHAP
jgi:hypothetical protein